MQEHGLKARADAHILRLAMALALFEGSSMIDDTHVTAAGGLFQYSVDSMKYFLGDLNRTSGTVEGCKAAMVSYLQERPADGAEVKRHLVNLGFSVKQIRVARERLGVTTKRTKNYCQWSLRVRQKPAA